MTSQDIRFKAIIDAFQKTLNFEDVTSYSPADLISSGLLKIYDSNGNVVYKNVGYDTDTYDKPDIINEISTERDVDITMLLDENGKVKQGDYTIDYKLAVFTLTTHSYSTHVLAGNLKEFYIEAEAGNPIFSTMGFITIDTGVNAGTYKIVSTDDSGADLKLTFEVDLTAHTSLSVDLKYEASSVYYYPTKDFKYCYEPTEVKIEYIIKCLQSELTSTDNTDYQGKIDGIWTQPTSVVRTHTVAAPLGSGYPAIPDTSDRSRIFQDIWTKVWQTSISSVVTFNVEDWDSATWLIYKDTLTGSSEATVNCTSCTCDMRGCIDNLYTQYQEAITTNKILADKLGRDIASVNIQYTGYLQAERCGADTTPYCEAISTILKRNSCNCGETSDKGSELVVATDDSSVILGGGRARIIMENQSPHYDVGSDGDMFIDTSTYNYYYKILGSWVYQGNIKGAKGDRGDDGVDGKGWTAGGYIPASGQAYFSSADGLGFTTDDLRGADGSGVVIRGADTIANIVGLSSPDSGDMWIVTADYASDPSYPDRPGGSGGLAGDGITFDGTNWINVGAIRGEDGVSGKGWTSGAYDVSTGVVTFSSADGLGFTTSDLRGSDGVGIDYDFAPNGGTTKAVGGIPLNTSYGGADQVKQILDDLLWSYVKPLFTSFTSSTTQVEVGYEITSLTFAWATSTPANVAAGSVYIKDGSTSLYTGGNSSNSGQNVTLSLQLNTANHKSLYISGLDTNGDAITVKYRYIYWIYRVFFGASSTLLTSSSTDAQAQTLIDVLQQSHLDANKVMSWTTTSDNNDSNNYTYIVYPASYGDLTTITQDGSLPVLTAFTKVKDFTFSNAEGVSVSMRLYVSNIKGAFASGVVLTTT